MIRHLLIRRRLALLASGVLSDAERRAVEEHLAQCPRCRRELEELRAVVELAAADPLRRAEPEIPLAALVTRVQARLDAGVGSFAAPRRWRWALWPAAALAAGVLALIAPRALVSPPPAPAAQISVSSTFLDRLERNLARGRAARYLNEAQDVLVTVAATARNCDRAETLDVAQEARRSRELLEQRALLVELDRAEVASVRPVLEDVDNALREVASLPSCARPRDVETIHRQISRRHLLMKISLMQRELRG